MFCVRRRGIVFCEGSISEREREREERERGRGRGRDKDFMNRFQATSNPFSRLPSLPQGNPTEPSKTNHKSLPYLRTSTLKLILSSTLNAGRGGTIVQETSNNWRSFNAIDHLTSTQPTTRRCAAYVDWMGRVVRRFIIINESSAFPWRSRKRCFRRPSNTISIRRKETLRTALGR
ncbi:hypothetical protein B0H34DRAFT_472149 [Crassisporium funariophilum]|nr:hypothetical protein B0H34DRAFT_472149 [Crassisporium funariophilum]